LEGSPSNQDSSFSKQSGFYFSRMTTEERLFLVIADLIKQREELREQVKDLEEELYG
jgi:hypothetical protein